MAKIIDITDRLTFDENPKIKIKNKVFEVNGDAKTMLEIMGDFGNKSEVEAALSAYERMFSEKDRKSIDNMKLPFRDLMTIITSAMNLIQGDEEDEKGEE